MEKHWKTKKQMRDRIEELKRYNDYLRDFKKVHESRRDDDASIFAIGWNQAISHVEALIVELLGVDDKAAYEEFGI